MYTKHTTKKQNIKTRLSLKRDIREAQKLKRLNPGGIPLVIRLWASFFWYPLYSISWGQRSYKLAMYLYYYSRQYVFSNVQI